MISTTVISTDRMMIVEIHILFLRSMLVLSVLVLARSLRCNSRVCTWIDA